MPEKTLNEIPVDLRRLYAKATESSQRENWEYAATMFCQVLDREPTFFECRKALRIAQQRKAAGASGGFFKKMMSSAGSSPQIAKAKMALGKNPAEAISLAEQVLNGDPNNSFAHRIIVDAAEAMQMPQTAVLSLEVLAHASPKDKAIVIEYANMVASTNGQADAAEKLLEDLIAGGSFDPDVAQAQKNLSAHQTIDKGGYNKAGEEGASFRDMLRNKEEAVALEQESKVQKSEDTAERLINEYEGRLQAEPQNYKMIRSLAELYVQKNGFDRALDLYRYVLSAGPDASLEKAISEAQVRKFDFELAQLDPTSPDYNDHVARINADKLKFQTEECQKRVEKYPTDMGIRYEMGVLNFQAGKISEAIGDFQKAQTNPHKRIAAMCYLAQCFAKRGMNDSAVRTLQNAIKEKPVFDEEKKDLIYQLGCVLEKTGKKAEAIEQFLVIYELDINYRDVAAKVDAHYAGQ